MKYARLAMLAMIFVLAALWWQSRLPEPGAAAPMRGEAASVSSGGRAVVTTPSAPPAVRRPVPAPAPHSVATPASPRDASHWQLQPVAEVARDYAQRAARARAGDAEAAMTLFNATQSCAAVASDPADLAGRLREAARNGRPGPSLDRRLEYLRAQFDHCAPLSAAQRAEWRDWLHLAAQAGDAQAQLRFVLDGAPERAPTGRYWEELDRYRSDAARYLDAQLAQGNPDALWAASVTYGSNSLYRRDEVKRVAYLRALLLSSGETQGINVDDWRTSEAAMKPEDRARAEALAADIYRRCCAH